MWLVDLLFPPRCAGCGRSAAGPELAELPAAHAEASSPSDGLSGPGAPPWLLCQPCRSSLTLLRPPLCRRCGAPTAWPVERCVECSGRRLAFTSARAAVAYDGVGRALVHAWKERGLRPLVALAAELVAEAVPAPAVDVITYIPPDGDRSLKRGHQPAKALAHELALRWNLEARPLLGRTRDVARQAGLTRVERRRNVRNAFAPAAPPTSRPPLAVALVDDVYTTGATAAAAASALRAAGMREVHVVTFARVIR